MRVVVITLLAALTLSGVAHAQIPSGVGQQPGTLPPAPPVIPPPPLAVPAPVPPASAGPPSVFQGTAQSRPSIYNAPLSTGGLAIYRGKKIDRPPKKKRKKYRRPRVSGSTIWHLA